jgi:hypothetical protein
MLKCIWKLKSHVGIFNSALNSIYLLEEIYYNKSVGINTALMWEARQKEN